MGDEAEDGIEEGEGIADGLSTNQKCVDDRTLASTESRTRISCRPIEKFAANRKLIDLDLDGKLGAKRIHKFEKLSLEAAMMLEVRFADSGCTHRISKTSIRVESLWCHVA